MAATQTRSAPVLRLSLILGGALRDSDGARLGKVDDVIVRLEDGYPPITGFLVTVAGRRFYLPAERVARVEPRSVTLSTAKHDLRPFSRRPEEILLKHDVLDHQLINVEGAAGPCQRDQAGAAGGMVAGGRRRHQAARRPAAAAAEADRRSTRSARPPTPPRH